MLHGTGGRFGIQPQLYGSTVEGRPQRDWRVCETHVNHVNAAPSSDTSRNIFLPSSLSATAESVNWALQQQPVFLWGLDYRNVNLDVTSGIDSPLPPISVLCGSAVRGILLEDVSSCPRAGPAGGLPSCLLDLQGRPSFS